jgi:carboxymethylenebutenolidase
MDRELLRLYDAFTHGDIDRREFLARAGQLLGGVAAATWWIDHLRNDYALAQLTDPADERLNCERTKFPSSHRAITIYTARLREVERAPAVVVIHENRGLNPHIEDVARRLAAAGFFAIAPNAIEPDDLKDEDRAREAIAALDPAKTLAEYLEVVEFARKHADSTGAVGCVGFCWGGAMANQLAVHAPGLTAAVAFYGRQAAAEDVPQIKAALQLHYAGLDERINAGIETYRSALEASKVRFELYMYDGVNHAFHNDTSPQRYDADAAKLAWQRTLEFLHTHLEPESKSGGDQ